MSTSQESEPEAVSDLTSSARTNAPEDTPPTRDAVTSAPSNAPNAPNTPNDVRGPGQIVEAMGPTLERRALVKGTKPGGSYVRMRLPHAQEFRPRANGVLEATARTLTPHTRAGRASARVKRFLLGERLTTAAQINERLTKVKALAVLSSDAISSVAYGTEASLGILIVAGTAALGINLAIAACIALLMVIVGTSYFQTIHAYPQGGGSYIVARDNMGDWPGLVAAASLLIDYVLTVSVSVSSGVDALTSAIRPLQHDSVALGVFFIVVIMVINLRGIRESGTIFAAPTYLFIGAFLIMIVTGIIHAALMPGGLFGHVTPTTPPTLPLSKGGLGWEPGRLGLVLILTAFASGCSAMTGVEAISDGVPAFKSPESHNAGRTLVWMISILVTLFLGITYLAWRFGIEPNPAQHPTVDSQIASLLFSGFFGWFYYVVQLATLLILVLAANTSFSDFPRLSSFLARDGFMPRQFLFRGDRLAFTTGIVVLGVLSSLLLIVFEGRTDALINLYALGVFTAFTLSQTGMVLRWYRRREAAGANWRRSMAINGLGATVTGIVALIIMFTKFERGAWIVVLLVPLLVLLFRGISRHYAYVRRATVSPTPLNANEVSHIAIVPIGDLNLPAAQSLAYAYSLTSQVLAVHIAVDANDEAKLREDWRHLSESRRDSWERLARADDLRERASRAEGRQVATQPKRAKIAAQRPGPQLVIIESPYRSLIAPLIAYIDVMRDEHPAATVSVILPEFVPAHWWERFLHNQTALRLKLALYSHPGVVVVNVPYHLPRIHEEVRQAGS